MNVNPCLAVAAGAVAVVAALGVGAAMEWGGSDDQPRVNPSRTPTTVRAGVDLTDLIDASGFGDPSAVEIPPVADGSTLVWLEGDGQAAVGLVTETTRLWADGAPSCDEVADALDALGTPEDIAGAAAQTPDGPTQEILLGLHAVAGSALRSCDDPAAFDAARPQLGWQWALADRRLTEIGIER